MKVIALVNHKGGVGKTTSVMNIAAAMALKNKNILAIDTDPQGNLTDCFGVKSEERTIYHAFNKPETGLPIVKVKKNLDIVPCNLDFAGIELEISSRIAREKILKELLESCQDKYDYCIIDCPPSLGLITLNVLVASDSVYIPMLAEYLPYRGIDSIVGIIKQVQKHYNNTLKINGVFFTQYKGNQIMTREIKKMLVEQIGDVLMDTEIRVNVELSEAQAGSIDIFEYNENSKGADDYKRLTAEILKRG